jgi:IS1 family transposase
MEFIALVATGQCLEAVSVVISTPVRWSCGQQGCPGSRLRAGRLCQRRSNTGRAFTWPFSPSYPVKIDFVGPKWQVVKIGGRWWYLYRAVDQFGQVIDVLATDKRDAAAARRFFTRALRQVPRLVEVTTDKASAYLGVLEELLPAARHVTERYGNNRVEADHGRLKARLGSG